MERLSTGNTAADGILWGGFPKNSINVILGSPGTGKTVFVQQIAWHNANGGRPILYCTTLSEPLSKLVRYLQELDFFEPSHLGSSLLYEDLGETLSQEGLNGLSTVLRDKIKEHRPGILVIDSFKAAEELGGSVQEVRRTTFELAGLLSAYDVTTFLIGEYYDTDILESPVFAAADGILEFLRISEDRSEQRYLRVLKLRGSDYWEGLHSFTITSKGLEIHPRLTIPEHGEEFSIGEERVSSGVPGLDPLLSGGLQRRSTTLLMGGPGTGKTTMALQFALDGARSGESSLFVGFQEHPDQLAQRIRKLAPGLSQEQRDNFSIYYQPPVELQIDRIVGEVFDRAEKSNTRRVVVDALGELAIAASGEGHLHDYVHSLIQGLASKGITSLLTAGLELERKPLPSPRMNHVVDNIVVVQDSEETPGKLSLRVQKCRFSDHHRSPRTLELGDFGARIADDY